MSYLAGLACGTFSRHAPSPLPRRQRRNLRPVQQERRRSGTLRPLPVPDDQLVHSGVQGGGTVGGDAPPQGTTAWEMVVGGGCGGRCIQMYLGTTTPDYFPTVQQNALYNRGKNGDTCVISISNVKRVDLFYYHNKRSVLSWKNKSTEQQEEKVKWKVNV